MNKESNIYQTFLRARVKGAIEEAKAASKIDHNGLKGLVLEILISKLFRPLLPSDISIGTGQILDQYTNKLSTQVDIILYDKSILPPILFDDNTGIFPIESVLYAVEVKTRLTKAELKKAHYNARLLKDFNYLPGELDKLGNEQHHEIQPVVSSLFALRSNMSSERKSEIKRYAEVYLNERATLSNICIVDKGYWKDDNYHWCKFEGKDSYDEILAFIGVVMNSYKSIAESRKYPLLGNYIIPDGDFVKGIQSRNLPLLTQTCNTCSHVSNGVYSYSEEYMVEAYENEGYSLKGKDECEVIGELQAKCSCGGTLASKHGRFQFRRDIDNYDLVSFNLT